MKPRLETTPVLPLCAVSLALSFAGCVGNQKQFKITSHPPGASIYVDGEKRGQTNLEKLNIVFPPKQMVTLRVEKKGYQPEGMVLDMMKTPQELFIVLHESPRNDEIAEGLKRIQSLLETLPGRVADQARNEEIAEALKRIQRLLETLPGRVADQARNEEIGEGLKRIQRLLETLPGRAADQAKGSP